jgi:hypothetical protein
MLRYSVKLNPLILMSTVVAALGGLLLGFDTAVIAGARTGELVATRAIAVAYGCTALGGLL